MHERARGISAGLRRGVLAGLFSTPTMSDIVSDRAQLQGMLDSRQRCAACAKRIDRRRSRAQASVAGRDRACSTPATTPARLQPSWTGPSVKRRGEHRLERPPRRRRNDAGSRAGSELGLHADAFERAMPRPLERLTRTKLASRSDELTRTMPWLSRGCCKRAASRNALAGRQSDLILDVFDHRVERTLRMRRDQLQ